MSLTDPRGEEWLTPTDLKKPPTQHREPKFDKEVSKIVGKPVSITDGRLIKLVGEWKKKYGSDDRADNFLQQPDRIIELKRAFGVEI